MNLQEQHFLIDIDNTVTRYRKEASASGATLFGNCFLPVVRDLMIRRGWEREAAEKALFESVNNVLRWDYSELLRRFSIPWEEASGLMMLRHEEMLDVYQDAVELIRRLKAAGAHLWHRQQQPILGLPLETVAGWSGAGLVRAYFQYGSYRRMQIAGICVGFCDSAYRRAAGTDQYGRRRSEGGWCSALVCRRGESVHPAAGER